MAQLRRGIAGLGELTALFEDTGSVKRDVWKAALTTVIHQLNLETPQKTFIKHAY